MDFSRYDDPESLAFIEEVRAFLDRTLTAGVLEEAEASEDNHHPDFYRALGEKGWLLPWLPEEEGGRSLDARRIDILETELAVRGAPIVNVTTTRMIYPAVAEHISPVLREEVLDDIRSGRSAVVLGYTEPEGGSDIAAAKLRATRDGDDWILSGTKVFTTGAHHARYVFLLAMTSPDKPKRKGLTMFLVPLDSTGIVIAPIHTIGERTNVVYFGDARVHDSYRLGDVDSGWEVLLGPLNAEHGVAESEADGGMNQARTYIQRGVAAFDRAADWVLGDHGRRNDPIMHEHIGAAAMLLHSGSAATGLAGRITGSEHWERSSAELMDMLGSESLDGAGSTGAALDRSRRNAQVSKIYGGSVEVFRNLIARELGLPSPVYRR